MFFLFIKIYNYIILLKLQLYYLEFINSRIENFQ